MGVLEKLTKQASETLSETVLAATMVVPPGATLYKGYSPDSKALAVGGVIASAIASKLDGGGTDGTLAARVPTQMGVLAVCADRVVFCKKKTFGTGCGDPLCEWPRADVEFVAEDNGKWSYPGLLLQFSDSSTCVVFGEKRWDLHVLATV